MPDADKTLKILLQLQADVAQGKAEVTGALKEIEAQAAQTAAAVRSVTITDSSVLPEGFDRGDSAKAVALRSELDARVAAKRAAQEAAAVDLAASAAAGAAAEERTIAQARIDAQMERRVIIETQVEAAEARLAGNTALAVKLEREADIRARSLAIQRTLNITTEESIVLAEKLVLAEEGSVVATNAMGINMAKMKTEALVFGREAAAGNIRASTMSSLLGSMGTTLTIAGIAAYTIYEAIKGTNDFARELTTEFQKQTAEISKQMAHWAELAGAAGSFDDVNRIGEKMQADLDSLAAKLAEFRKKELGLMKQFVDTMVVLFGSIPGLGDELGPNQAALNAAIDQGDALLRKSTLASIAFREAGEKAKKVWEDLKTAPVDVAVDTQFGNLERAKAKYDSLRKELQDLQTPKQTVFGPVSGGIDPARAAEVSKQLSEAGRDVELQTKRMDELSKKQKEVADGLAKIATEAKKASFEQLDPQGKIKSLTGDITVIQEKLRGLGVDASSLPKALEAARQKSPEVAGAVIKLTGEWAKMGNEIVRIENQASRGVGTQREITAELRSQANILAQIQANKHLTESNPFLSADQKAAATIRNDVLEVQALGVQLKRDQELQAKLTDPAQWAQMEGKIIQAKTRLTELGFEMKKLSFAGGFRAEMVSWVNSFGTAAKQVASIITGTLNTAINATSQAITNAIFKTGNWKQAFMQAAQSIVQNLITIGIQMLASWVLSKFIKQNDASGSMTAGAQIASAYAPGAAAASIATSGGSAYSGAAAAAVAIAAIIGALTLGAKEGMYIDRGTTPTADDVHVRVSKGEGIINAREVSRRGGKSWVDSINSGVTRPSYASGGTIGGTASAGVLRASDQQIQVHIFNFTDERRLRKAIMDSNAGRKIIIDTINGRRVDLGLPS